jgi:hypothetical protein
MRTIVLAALAGALIATAATASAANPLVLALQHADMPSTVENHLAGPAKPEKEDPANLRFIGTGLKGADYSYEWPAGGTVKVAELGPAPKQWHVYGEVFVAPSVAAATKLFADGKAAQTGFFSDFPTDHVADLTLPHYGDEQFALVGPDGGGPQAMVFVRKGSVVWELRVSHNPAQWTVTKAPVVALLKTYAAKQKARVG